MMERPMYLGVALLIATTACVSCGGSNDMSTTATPKAQPTANAQPAAQKPVEVTKTPTAMAVSTMDVEFTPKPKCDGGECYDIKFDASFKFDGEEATTNKQFSFVSFDYEVGGAKQADEIVSGKKLHVALVAAKPENLRVTLVDGTITKIVRVEEWRGKDLVPGAVLWEE